MAKKWNKGDMLEMTNSSKNSTKTTTNNLQPLACETPGKSQRHVHQTGSTHHSLSIRHRSHYYSSSSSSLFLSFIHSSIIAFFHAFSQSVCQFVLYFFHSLIISIIHAFSQSVCLIFLIYFMLFIYIFIHLLVRALIC